MDALYNINFIKKMAKKYPDIVEQETISVLRGIIGRLETEIAVRTPKGVGGAAGLAGSIYGDVQSVGVGVVQGLVGSPLEYGEVIELGRRPGSAMPPVEPLALWAIRKLGVDEDESMNIGFAIAKSIARYGFKTYPEGAQMFSKAWEESSDWVFDELKTIPERVVRRNQIYD